MQLTLANRLYAAFGTITLVMLLSAGMIWKLGADAERRLAEASDRTAATAALADAQSALWSLRWGFAQYIALGDAAKEARAKILADEPVQHRNVLAALDAFAAKTHSAAEQKGLADLRAAYNQYFESRAPWFKLMADGKTEEAVAWRAKNTTPFGAATVKTIGELVQLQRKTADAVHADAVATTAQLRNLLEAAQALGVLLALAIAAWAVRAMTRPVRDAVEAMQRLAGGDLSTAMQVQRDDEMGQLLRAVDATRSSLADMVGRLRHGIDSVATASQQIAQGNQDLSSRTEQQASSLQQTASSMEEMTGTVQQSADNARAANDIAGTASQAATKGGAIVGQVVSTMSEITTASKKIGDIIAVIDGIAFQTNILALNAAVEAARAGEQGRGFAVVAGEVRTLAQRSADAAREIKGLITASVDRVEVGNQQVALAGAAMDDIVAQVQRVTSLIGEITLATGEQSQGIGQVNAAVAQLDQMTQQNAALVEQSAAAAASLRSQADALAQAVGEFRLGTGSAGRPSSLAHGTVAMTAL